MLQLDSFREDSELILGGGPSELDLGAASHLSRHYLYSFDRTQDDLANNTTCSTAGKCQRNYTIAVAR